MSESSGVTRRRWSEAFKRQVVTEASAPGVSVAAVARRYDLNANLIFNWRRRYGSAPSDAGIFLPVQVVPDGLPSDPSGPIVSDTVATASLDAPVLDAAERVGIVLTNGRRLDIALSVDDVALTRLVRVLERA